MISQEETIKKLLEKKITPNECLLYLDLKNLEELDELIKYSNIPRKRKRRLSIQNIGEMNYLEIRDYLSKSASKRINISDLAIEADIKWENGEISGFDYRYFIETTGLKIKKEFISRAKSIGRYDK